MKHFYLSLVLLFSSLAIIAQTQTFHDTQGKFEVSPSGQATFTLPIALPPSIQDVGPTINLVYASGQMGGIAGQGWDISAISNISRIATRKDIDGFVDGVDFDDNDKLALDGQRLMIKTGTYWADGSTYETEVQSNTRVKFVVTGGIITFEVTAPDGSRSLYGGVNCSDITAFYINRFEDTKGNFINYTYNKPFNKSLCINEILFSANTNSNLTPLNKIKFNYVAAARTENAYVGGQKVEKVEILNNIQVFTNGQQFKKYQLTHFADNLGYQKVSKLQEFNGVDVVGANPVLFEYYNSSNSETRVETPQDDATLNNMASPKFNGDFTGEGDVDFIKGNIIYKNQLGATPSSETLPFTADANTYAVNTNIKSLTNSILKVETSGNNLILKNYDLSGSSCLLNNSKTVLLPSLTIPIEYRDSCSGIQIISQSTTTIGGINSQYITGDFNGDGISDLIAYNNSVIVDTIIQSSIEYVNDTDENGNDLGTGGDQCVSHVVSSTGFGCILKFVDLNPAVSNNENSPSNTTFTSNHNIMGSTYRYVLDLNADGKDDILNISPSSGNYNILSLKTLLVAPWYEFELIGQGNFAGYSLDKPFVFGDFNGDGKIDITQPAAIGSPVWRFFYCNPKVNTSNNFFDEIPENINIPYIPFSTVSSNRWYDWYEYFGLDVNKDGKTDLTVIKTSVYTPDDPGYMNRYTNYRPVVYLKKDIGFQPYYDGGAYEIQGSDRFEVVAVNKQKNYITQDLVILEKKWEFPNGFTQLPTFSASLHSFSSSINQADSFRLKKVTQSNGAIIDEIFYKTLDANNVGYTPDNSAVYPNVNINRIPNLNLVDYVKNTSLGTDKYQAFKYYGYTVNYSGLGSLGFQKTSRSSWYQQDSPKITWSVSENDPLKRGALTRTYLKLMNRHDVFAFNNYNNLLSKTENEYNPPSPPNIFPYVLTLDKQTTTDYLTNVKTEKSFKYSNDGFYLPTETKTENYLGSVVQPQGSSYTKTEFCPNSFGTGSSYYIGRPDNTKTVTTAYGDTKSSYTKLSYTGSNVTTIEKRVGTDENSLTTATEKIIETMTYAPNGNLLSKTILPTGFPVTTPPIAARTTSFTYDTTNRFVKTSTDVELLVTTNNTYHPLYGAVTSQTNPFGQTTTSLYDNWGKQTSVTDFLGKSISYLYTRTNIQTEVTQIGSDGSQSTVINDIFNRVFKSGKDLNGNIIGTRTDKNWKEQVVTTTEPFLSGATTALESKSEYDEYGRTTKTIAHTGQETTYAYNGLTTTVYDGKITNTTVKNANGHVVSTTELADGSTPNTIIYTYDANGNLLTSNYGGTGMTMEYDLWGRKTKLIDPAAGITTYTYNGYGEMLVETNPKGAKTTLTYNAVGKPLTKVEFSAVVADATNISTTYNYDGTRKWLTSMVVTDPYGGNSNYSYTYDTTGSKPTFQLKETIENQVTLGAKFTKTLSFDDFGRPATETNKAEMGGKTSTKTIFNVYANGVIKEIKDTNATGFSIWKTETVNARGQLTKGIFGNGINELNSYDGFGYFSEKKFNNLNLNLLTIAYAFDPLRGNLGSRTNTFFNTYEEFGYDTSDRLNYSIDTLETYQNCQFTTGVDGFTVIDNVNSLATLNGRLQYNYGEKILKKIGTIPSGKALLVDFEYNTFSHSSCPSVPYNCNNANLWYKIYEKNPVSGVISNEIIKQLTFNSTAGQINMNSVESTQYNTLNNSDVYIEFYTIQYTGQYSKNLGVSLDNVWCRVENTYNQNYDNRGRITDNELGSYGYPSSLKIYQNNRVKLLPESQPYYLVDRFSQTITYNAYKCPIDISEPTKERISFGYNAMHDRSVMYYGSTATSKLARPFRKFYSADGSMEIKYSLATNSYEFVTYLGGDAYSASAVVKSDGTTQNIFYLHRDNQSSILAVSNATGAVIERHLFDAWGQLAKFEKNGVEVAISSLNATNGMFLDRGYTGHEHLLGVGLINMNARLYDPKLRRFLQTDNEVQDPSKAQDYNRYGYCLNNPLKFTDPSGNHPILIGIAIAAILHVGTALIFNQPLKFGGLFQAVVLGALTSAATFGIGEMTEAIKSLATKVLVQAAAHGAWQGTFAAIQGGNFWQGAAAGVLSSLASSAWQGGQNRIIDACGGESVSNYQGLGNMLGISGSASMITFGTIMGGVGAALTGGNFWQGAATGLVVSGLNHAMHQGDDGDPIKKRPDADGEVTLSEANEHYRNGGGKDLFQDLSKMDLDFISSSDFDFVGQTKTFQTLFKSSNGLTYGQIDLTYKGGTTVVAGGKKYDTYNFERHGNRSTNPNILKRVGENMTRGFRNFATVAGRMVADRFPFNLHNQEFKINFYGAGKISR